MDKARIGFLQLARLRVLQAVECPDRERWIESYLAVRSKLDAAIFMTEAKLKLAHAIDVYMEARLEAGRRASDRARMH